MRPRRARALGEVGAPYDLQRFELAQDERGIYDQAVEELRAGHKQTHWMWFVFPQIAGLGRSRTAKRFAIASGAEAEAYLAHPVLGPRLVQCARILVGFENRTALQIFGPTDAQKLHSSMTLFAHAGADEPVFRQVLELYFDGVDDAGTTQRI